MKSFANKLNAILLGGLLGGILLAGLGSGIAFAEYMSFEYDDSLVSEKTVSADEFTYEMTPNEVVVVPTASSLSFDDAVPVGTVITRVEYNPQTIEIVQNVYGSGPGNATVVETYPRYISDDFATFMESKDVILQGLKDGKIVSFESDYHFSETALCNPADKGRVFRSVEEAAYATGATANANGKVVG